MKLALLPLFALAGTSAEPSHSSPFPEPLAAGFQSADQSIQKIGMCLGPEAINDSVELDAFEQRYFTLLGEASMTWGNRNVAAEPSLYDEIDVDCASQDVAALFDAGSIALASLETGIKDHMTPFEAGVWIGPIPLCGRPAVRTEISAVEHSDIHALLVTVDAATSAEIAKITEASVGHPLAIRANGEVVVAPTIHEPLLGGQFQIVGPDRQELERIAAQLAGCAT